MNIDKEVWKVHLKATAVFLFSALIFKSFI